MLQVLVKPCKRGLDMTIVVARMINPNNSFSCFEEAEHGEDVNLGEDFIVGCMGLPNEMQNT